MYKDLDGNGVVNNGANTLNDHGDVKLLGNSTPRWLFSLDLHGEYKGFDLRVYFQGVAKRDYWQGSGYFGVSPTTFGGRRGLSSTKTISVMKTLGR